MTFVSIGFGNIIASADDLGYEGCPSNVLEMITVRNRLRNLLRIIEWAFLKFLANAIDYFDNAVDTLLKLNLFDYLSDAFSFGSMQAAVAAVMSIALIIGVCAMVLFHDKIHVSEFLMSIMVSVILLIAFPSFISACNMLKSKGVKAAQNVEISANTEQSSVDKEGIVTLSTLGSDLLAEGVYDVFNSVNYKEEMSYADVFGNSADVKNINVTGVLEPTLDSPWTAYYITDINDVQPEQKKYSELTTENMMELLGLGSEYYTYTHIQDKFILVVTYLSGGGTGCLLYTSQAYQHGCVVYEDEWETIVSASFGPSPLMPFSVKIGELVYSDGSHITNVNSFESYLKDQIANHPAVKAAGKTQAVGANSRTIDEALDIIKDDVIRELNIQANTRTAESAKSAKNITAEYKAEPLDTEEDYEDLSDIKAAIREYIYPGYTADYLYFWHIDFPETLVIMLAVLICLVFSGVKITTTLFEIMFSQIITPFIIATDLNNSGRAKKAIQNMLLSNIILMIVVVLFRLYLSVIWGVRDSEYGDNFAVVLIVIIAGAKFVIDGPDILTKLFGIDAGVKSGAGAILAITQTAQMGSYSLLSLSNMGSRVVGGAVHGGQKLVKMTGGAVAGGAKGFTGGAYGGIKNGGSIGGKVGRGFVGAAAGTMTVAIGGAFGHTDAGAKAGYKLSGAHPIESMKNTVDKAKNTVENVKNMSGEERKDAAKNMFSNMGGKLADHMDNIVGANSSSEGGGKGFSDPVSVQASSNPQTTDHSSAGGGAESGGGFSGQGSAASDTQSKVNGNSGGGFNNASASSSSNPSANPNNAPVSSSTVPQGGTDPVSADPSSQPSSPESGGGFGKSEPAKTTDTPRGSQNDPETNDKQTEKGKGFE